MRALCGVLALSLLCGGASGAQAPAAPLTFMGCTVIDGSRTFTLQAPPGRAVINVMYRNDGSRTVAEVRTAMLVDGAPLWVYHDVATTSPGTTVHRRAEIPYKYFPLEAQPTCAIVHVRYADGTTWTSPAVDASEDVVQTPESHIAIERCDLMREELTTYTNLTFVNSAPKAANRVVFSMWAGGKLLERYENSGMFSPGVRIVLQLYSDTNLYPVRALRHRCRVDEVDYADGTMWKNPDPDLRDAFGTPQSDGSRIDVLRCSTAALVNANGRKVIVHVDHGVEVDFRNAATMPATRVEFDIVAFGRTVAHGRDSGTFAPGVEIVRRLGLPPDVLPLGTALPACIVQRVEYADGTSWVHP